MLKNHLTIALRTFWKHKSFSATNVAGLALSMSVCLLIILFVREQKNYDLFHENAVRTFRVVADAVDPDSNIVPVGATPAPLAAVLESEFPGVDKTVRLRQLKAMATAAGKTLGITGLYADPSFFDVFSFPLERGRTYTALEHPNTVVLTAATAERFFGDREAVGERMVFEDGTALTVTGVFAADLGSSHLKFDAVASMRTLRSWSPGRAMLDDWRNYYSYYTYVVLQDARQASALESGFSRIIERYYPPEQRRLYSFELQPLTAINLGSIRNNEIGFILPALVAYILAGLAAVVMLAAVFNYVGLVVARSLTRAREIGIRKASGARRHQIVRQFLAESVLTALVAAVGAFGLLSWIAARFNELWFVQMSGTEITLDFGDPSLYLILIGFAVAVGLLAGLYPAIYLSRYQPVRVLKGLLDEKGMAGMRIRKVLIVSQFALSVVLVVSMAALYKQLQFMTHADYGFADEDIVNVALQDVDYEVLRSELVRNPSIVDVSATSKLPASGSVSGVWLKTGQTAEAVRGYEYAVDEHFIRNLGLELVAGRDIGEAWPSGAVVINQTAVADLGFETPAAALDGMITLNDTIDVRVAAVVEDYQFDMLDSPIRPLILFHQPEQFRYANVRIRPGGESDALAHVEATWTRLAPDRPLEHEFFRSQLENSLINIVFRDFLRVIGLIALLAVVIACLGTLGMAAYSVERRRREVGVRKVLGAAAGDVVLLLSKDFLKLVGIGLFIATPVAWFVNRLWLQEFANRTDFGPAVLMVSIGALVVVALVTIGSQTLRAALTDPVTTLRQE